MKKVLLGVDRHILQTSLAATADKVMLVIVLKIYLVKIYLLKIYLVKLQVA